MNGTTIQVTTEQSKVPKGFLPLNNLDEIKAAVALEMGSEGNLGLMLTV